MFNLKKKDKDSPEYFAKIDAFLQLIRAHPMQTENFLDSLSQLSKIFDTTSLSLYLYEKKTNMFVLKKWVGEKPMRFSISGEYEFINYLKNRGEMTERGEFSPQNANELRQAALLYFQQTVSNLAYPLIDNQTWLGVLNIHSNIEKPDLRFVLNSLTEIYADVLKRWLVYQDMVQQNKKLSEVSHVKNQLLANVTHELQTPLNGILGIADALKDDPDLSEEHKISVKMIQKSGDELHQTVNNILELVQIEAKKNQTQQEKVNILTLIDEVVSLYSDSCKKKNVQIVVPKTRDSYFVYIQQDQMRTVLMNLIGNAVKFTQEGEIKIELRKSGEKLHVSIIDTGIGIDDDKLNLIFEEFYQADGSHTRVYGGTGLGLAIVKKIVGLHGGRIWVESQKGIGSTFTFTVPLYPV